MQSREHITAVFTVWLRKAREEDWRLWRGDEKNRMEKLNRLIHGICEQIEIPSPTLRLDPSVSSFLGITCPISGVILVAKPSVVTTLHELAHYVCHRLRITNNEENARNISLRSFFAVWPEKRTRSDILYKDEV